MKVGRNDLCPCGSGKKYKKCCLGKPETPLQRPLQTFSEEDVVNTLLASSKEFTRFYSEERRKIALPIQWTRDESLPRGTDGSCTRNTSGGGTKQEIRLRRIPPDLGDASMVAHELEHLVLDSKGFRGTRAHEARYEILSGSLNSMVNDPLVYSSLQTYGFDIYDDYKKLLTQNRSQLSRIPSPPPNRLNRLLWILNYVRHILIWEVVSGVSDKGLDEFKLWFDERYPDVAGEGQKLLAPVRDIGYDTPEKQNTLFTKIIQEYGLGEFIKF
jgi:hypothetical protein